MQQASADDTTRFTIRGARRNGIDRLFLIGDLDRSGVLVLESELVGVAYENFALVLDLRGLDSIDRWGLRTLERAMERARRRTWRLSIVNGRGPVRDAFDRAGLAHLLSGSTLSDLLDTGDGEWPPVSLPPFLGRRDPDPPQIAWV
jgi:anti-anti-sigma factor